MFAIVIAAVGGAAGSTAPARGHLPLFPGPEVLLDIGVRVALTLAGAFLIQRLFAFLIGRVEKFMRSVGGEHGEQRARTLGATFKRVTATLIYGSALIRVVALFGWDVKPLLAGAGVVGVALGFGAQTLVRDMIAGMFILLEDQFGIGDLIDVNGKPANVEGMTLRYTQLRDFNGFVYFVPNGEMKIVINRSRGWQRMAVDIPVATDQDVDRALDVCEKVVHGMNQESAWRDRLMDPIELWGLESLSTTEATIRIVIRSRPGPDAPEASRMLRQRVHRALAQAGIRFGATREFTLTSPASIPPAVPAQG